MTAKKSKVYIKLVNGSIDYITIEGIEADVEIYTAEGVEYITSIPWIYHQKEKEL